MRATVMAIVAVASLSAAQQAPPTPPRDAPRPGASVASVSGRVTDKETGQPLRRIKVQLSRRSGDGRPFEIETDAEGRYAFSMLPAGEYYATAAPGEYRSGYMTMAYREDDKPPPPFSFLPSFELKAGDARTDVDFALARTFAIEGRVVNEYGEPLSDMYVFAEPADGVGGSMNVTTDDRGQFRLFAVPPGSWRVCAKPGSGGQGMPTGGDVLQVRLVRTCFPPAGSSAAVEVKTSDVAGVLILMQRERAFSLSGHVLDESGAPVQNATLAIERVESDNLRVSSISPEFAQGGFIARGLTPGDYVIRATVLEPFDRYAAPSFFAGPREMGLLTIRMDASDVRDVVVTTTRGVDVAGRVIFDGHGKPPASASRISVTTRRTRDAQQLYQNTPSAGPIDDFSFELRRVHGPVVLTAYDLSGEWMVKSIRYAGADITDVPTEFRAGADARKVEVTLTNRTARGTALAIDADGQPVPNAVVLVLPASPARWKAGFSGPHAADKTGDIALHPRVPGDYLIAALRGDDAVRLMRNPGVISELAARAQRITFTEGDHPRVDVRIVTLDGSR
jgi:5-hydroxyisourate hydrolase-like protein (transthyretin family)